ncbi:hypothetical protein N7495_005396 [Penicillium taxi]|uniref:uncharacterized protein n=1 Tax=Penicillium taxi TaxID=168475 RepID=UPI00254515BE|nr:uncharacterized protein N7495_005396 [Penicillium taxi]KAJ5893705.1 hypothetical protein N7495_005396 [Penicillium taxi]
MDSEDDPVIASYDIFLTDSEIQRHVFQYVDRPSKLPYNASRDQKPIALRMKLNTGIVEVEVPINTHVNYDHGKAAKYGDALDHSLATGGFGMGGGFNSGAVGSGAVRAAKAKTGETATGKKHQAFDENSKLQTQTLGGRIKTPEEGDPVHMLATFQGKNMFLSPVTAVVQLQPQLHHIDALDEMPQRMVRAKEESEFVPRVVDMKVRNSEDASAMLTGNLDLLQRMSEEVWTKFDWVDAETEEAWSVYEDYMVDKAPEELPQLEAALDIEDYLDAMSAPRIDPVRPDLTGWAMKQNRLIRLNQLNQSEQ